MIRKLEGVNCPESVVINTDRVIKAVSGLPLGEGLSALCSAIHTIVTDQEEQIALQITLDMVNFVEHLANDVDAMANAATEQNHNEH